MSNPAAASLSFSITFFLFTCFFLPLVSQKVSFQEGEKETEQAENKLKGLVSWLFG